MKSITEFEEWARSEFDALHREKRRLVRRFRCVKDRERMLLAHAESMMGEDSAMVSVRAKLYELGWFPPREFAAEHLAWMMRQVTNDTR